MLRKTYDNTITKFIVSSTGRVIYRRNIEQAEMLAEHGPELKEPARQQESLEGSARRRPNSVEEQKAKDQSVSSCQSTASNVSRS